MSHPVGHFSIGVLWLLFRLVCKARMISVQGPKNIRAELQEQNELSEHGGSLYIVPAPSLVTTITVKQPRSVRTKGNDDASIRLGHLASGI